MMLVLALLGCNEPAPPSAPAFTPPTTSLAPAAATPAVAEAPAAATPRSMADDAFNEAMQAHETGNPAAAKAVPRALTAYKALGTIDTDGQFHVALLELAADDAAAARKTCDTILAAHPNHLFALGTAGRAAVKSGDAKAARAYYERLVAAWDQPREALPEYEDHDRLLVVFQKEALTSLATAP